MREIVFHSLIVTGIHIHTQTHTETEQSIGSAYKSKIHDLDALSLAVVTKSSCNAWQTKRLARRPHHFQLYP